MVDTDRLFSSGMPKNIKSDKSIVPFKQSRSRTRKDDIECVCGGQCAELFNTTAGGKTHSEAEQPNDELLKLKSDDINYLAGVMTVDGLLGLRIRLVSLCVPCVG